MTSEAERPPTASKRGHFRLWLSAACAICVLISNWSGLAAEPPSVVVSLKPLHSLVAGVMRDVATPRLMMTGTASPHDYALRPSDAAALENAQRVFWMGPSLEGFLVGPLKSLAPATSVSFGDRLGTRIRPMRVEALLEAGEPAKSHPDGPSSAENLDHDHDDVEHGGEAAKERHDHAHADEQGHPLPDLHAWLDPTIAAAMVDIIASELGAADPERDETYRRNAEDMKRRLAELDGEIASILAPIKDRQFVVFHDAYQYLETRYALAHRGTLAVSAGMPPGARRVAAIRAEILDGDVVCVFSEPQFDPKLVAAMIDGTAVKSASLDPLGVNLDPGPDAYFHLMQRIAGTLRACLSY